MPLPDPESVSRLAVLEERTSKHDAALIQTAQALSELSKALVAVREATATAGRELDRLDRDLRQQTDRMDRDFRLQAHDFREALTDMETRILRRLVEIESNGEARRSEAIDGLRGLIATATKAAPPPDPDGSLKKLIATADRSKLETAELWLVRVGAVLAMTMAPKQAADLTEFLAKVFQ